MEIKPLKLATTNYTPKLIFREKAYFSLKKMMSSEFAKSTEFMCFGFVEKKTERNEYIISDFYLIPNKSNSGAYCEADETKLGDFYNKFPRPELKKIRCHCHSHVNMATSPSGTDNKQIEEFAGNVSNYFIQLIINHKDLNTCNILSKETGFAYYKVPMYIQIGNYAAKLKETDKDFIDIVNWSEDNGVTEELEIPNGNYQVKDGYLVVDDNLSCELNSGYSTLAGESLYVDASSIEIVKGLITEDVKKEIEKDFGDNGMTAKSYAKSNNYKSSYQGYGHSSYYQSGYYDNYGYGHGSNAGYYGSTVTTKTEKSTEAQKAVDYEDYFGGYTYPSDDTDTYENEEDIYHDVEDIVTHTEFDEIVNQLKEKHPKISLDQLADLVWEMAISINRTGTKHQTNPNIAKSK